MSIVELLLISLSLAMDALAVSLCKGLSMPKLNLKHALIISAFFGVFQAIMPLIGWLISNSFKSYIEDFDHWIAFGLLLLLGIKMIIDAIKQQDEEASEYKLDFKELTLLAISTSIDALAVGITLAFLGTSLWGAVTCIGVITFVLCFVGVIVGNKIGNQLGIKFQKASTIIGGVVLILIGLKILFQHLGIINF